MTKRNLILLMLPFPVFAIIFFFYLHWKYSVNIPIMDDYDAVIYFLSSFIDSKTITDKFLWLITQHREHRYIFPRCFILTYYNLCGMVNFKFILFTGLAALTGLSLVLIGSFRFLNKLVLSKNRILLISAFTLIFFNIQYWEGSTWAIAAFFFYFGLLFSFISLYFLSKEKNENFIVSIIFALLAVCTSGNGLLVFPAGLIVIFVQHKFSKKFLYWFLATVITFTLYFYHYVSPEDQTPVSDVLFHKQYKLLVFYLSYIGSVFRQLPVEGYRISVIAGILLIISFVLLIVKKYFRINPVNFSLQIFLFLTMLASSLGRVDVGFISRYTIFPTLLLISISIAFFETYSVRVKTKFITLFFILSVIFNLYSYHYNINDMKKMKDILVNGAILAKEGNYSLLVYPDSTSVKKLVEMGLAKNIYSFPEFGWNELSCCNQNLDGITESKQLKSEFNSITDSDKLLYVNGWIVPSPVSTRLILKSTERTFVFNTISMRRKELVPENKDRVVNDVSFSFAAVKKDLKIPEGSYRLGFLATQNDGNELIVFTDELIQFTN